MVLKKTIVFATIGAGVLLGFTAIFNFSGIHFTKAGTVPVDVRSMPVQSFLNQMSLDAPVIGRQKQATANTIFIQTVKTEAPASSQHE